MAKVSCISRHWGIQLVLFYSWARPAILVAGKGREGMFLFLLFLHFHSYYSLCPSLISSVFYLWVDMWLNPNTINCHGGHLEILQTTFSSQTIGLIEPKHDGRHWSNIEIQNC